MRVFASEACTAGLTVSTALLITSLTLISASWRGDSTMAAAIDLPQPPCSEAAVTARGILRGAAEKPPPWCAERLIASVFDRDALAWLMLFRGP